MVVADPPSTRTEAPKRLLLIEDNPGDARLVEEALREFALPTELYHVTNGQEALEFIGSAGQPTGRPLPDLILLDLNMPRRDGRELLTDLKKNPRGRLIPVIVLTTSNAERDIRLCYELGASCYLRKPVDVLEFLDMMRLIEAFWLKLVLLPTPAPGGGGPA